MNTRFRALLAGLLLLAAGTFAQSAEGHSVSRPPADSTSPGWSVALPIVGLQVDTSRSPAPDGPVPRSNEAPAPGGFTAPSAGPRDTARTGRYWRVGLHASAHDIGLQGGGSLRFRPLSLGLDLWVRPGVFTKEVRTTPTRRAQYKELLWGFDPWLQLEFGSDVSVALVAALDLVSATWYGTDQAPQPDFQPALGVRVRFARQFQVGIRGTRNEGILDRLRGEAVCEF